MNIFITGSNGFIGKHLKEYLQQKYSYYTLHCPNSKELDLIDESAVDNFIKNHKIDIIIHLANKGEYKIGFQNTVEYNLRIFLNLLKHVNKVYKFLSFGSGAEYGKHHNIINVKEEECRGYALDSYGFYKQIVSKLIKNCKNVIHLRLFGVYGEYEDYRFKFISNTICKNFLKLPIVINQNCFFDYIYIVDLIKIIDYALHHDMCHQIYNATSGERYRVDLLTIANIVNDLSDFKSDVIILNKGLNSEYTANNDRILSEMNGFKFTSHKKAISNMKAYYWRNLDKIDSKAVVDDLYLKMIQKLKENE
ncbi:NAD-dependent epimerase/dehydratase family protein [Campylobacter jejuni]|uniref:Sugar epimerase n=1 Tax=Campylobacter jejuni TaxID=197 RepID=A0A430YRA4_CAMJU|nr:NAD-dependent epimerase/dehydratase family protein [Campylobacter jejuni]RTJ07026.1 sugar epimerase [Campylobacter jejuni]RTJ35636.1 sugar epimerase [Campylobacter jejuni]RTJ98179.1 sugar epimerase [Campylobacter jejuni]